MEVLECVTRVALDETHLQEAELISRGFQSYVGLMDLMAVDQVAVLAQQKDPASAESSDASVPSAGTTAAEASVVAVQDQHQLLFLTFYSFSVVILSAFL